MTQWKMGLVALALILALAVAFFACGSSPTSTNEKATAQLKNDFNDPNFDFQPPWTICQSSYLGTQFGEIAIGGLSDTKVVNPGYDYVLLVAAWNDPTCNPVNCLPVASANPEEIDPGQFRTISLDVNNHQGPCPPEGVEPIPEAQYDRIAKLWPSYNFLPYAQRTNAKACQPADDDDDASPADDDASPSDDDASPAA
jgi:hypothetical protein